MGISVDRGQIVGWRGGPRTKNRTSPSPNAKAFVLERDGCCLRCGSLDNLTVDHIRAKADGGSNARENLQTLCEGCNALKADRSISYLEGEAA